MIVIAIGRRSNKGDLHAEASRPDRDEVALERELVLVLAHLQLEDEGVCGQGDSKGLPLTVLSRMMPLDRDISLARLA